ncbi:MAG: DMT family transporter [Syntrophorhabdaceae bacterium]|nr:DMT family transporter [Syntrophorhabdaceae bacterium]
MNKRPLLYIVISATLFGLSPPLAKILIKDIHPLAMAGLLYLGAFCGLAMYSIFKTILTSDKATDNNLKRKDLPWLFGAILSGGIFAPICLMFGLSKISGFTTSLLLNLEGVFTALIAVIAFKENAGKKVWLALACMTCAGVFLAWDSTQSRFNLIGPFLITLAMLGWGIDNNLTRNISMRNPVQVTIVKGFISGIVSIILSYAVGSHIKFNMTTVYALMLGSLSYGLSLVFFIKALEGLGSFRTGVFFSLAPFIGAFISLVVLREWIGWVIFPAVILTAIGFWLMSTEEHEHLHHHKEEAHAHSHKHDDNHHFHEHDTIIQEPHVHRHYHPERKHIHSHWPDSHHRHEH